MPDNPGMHPVTVLVINLDRDTGRLAGIAAQLDRLGLAWQRIPAVCGASLSEEECARLVDRAGYGRRHGMFPSRGEIGCYLSHLDAMRVLLASPAQQALILEDDVGLTEDLPEVLRALAAVPERWDMVKLSAVHGGTPRSVLPLTARHSLTVMLSQCTGSSAYVINRFAAQRYLERLLPMRLPYDHAYDRAWVLGLKVRRVDPLVALHDSEAPSTIAAVSAASGQSTAPSRKFPWYRRLSTYAWRIANELRRVFHGLMQVRRERRRVARDAAATSVAPVASEARGE